MSVPGSKSQSVPGSKSQQTPSQPAAVHAREVRLNWELPRWFPSLRENLSAAFGAEPAAPLGFRPGIFWKDVFVDQRLNWTALARSYAGHLVFAGLVYVLSMPFYWQRFVVVESFNQVRLEYIKPEEDVLASEPEQATVVAMPKLAPVISRSSRGAVDTAHDARKRIADAIAIPKWADNSTHTIVAPSAPNIPASAPIPDILLSTPIPQAPPVAAVASNTPKLVAPVLDVTPVAPPPDARRIAAALKMPALPQAAAIAPPVKTNGARNLADLAALPAPEAIDAEPKLTVESRHTLPALGTVEPVAPAPDLTGAARSQLARTLPGAAQPVAPPPEVTTIAGSLGTTGKLPGTAEPVGPPPDLTTTGTASSASGALISLNLNPLAGPPRIPDGNRRGTFAGSVTGRDTSTGAPALKSGSSGPGGDSPIATKEELGIVAAAVPHGIVNGGVPATGRAASSVPQNSLLAIARAPHISLPPPKVTTLVDEPNTIDARIFRGRKYYTMALNKPNLTSAGGSWIFRFAERGGASKAGEVTAPIPVHEVDAAYPADLMRDNVQGMVILYAVIRSDGSVAEVKVLEGFDDRLDENARKALSGWQFVPGTRDGNPVDLEAVVRIPFQSKRAF